GYSSPCSASFAGNFSDVSCAFLLTYFPRLRYKIKESVRGRHAMSPAAHSQLRLESFGMSSSETSQNLPIQPSPENSAGEQPVSQRRIEANRRNALRSTGPKSARGKDMAARNSWKHGLLAKSAVIMLGPAKENK